MMTEPSHEPLADDAVCVWHTSQDDFDDESVFGPLAGLLSEEEMARANRFVFLRDRRTYIVAHALQRTMLTRFGGHGPREWRFVTNQYGRPEIVEEINDHRLRFNLSHTRGLVACGVSVSRALGVDVEDTERMRSGVDVARRFFAPREVSDLMARPAEQQARAFFDYWTLKESYIKARGMGLSLPLEQFWFFLPANPQVRIAFDAQLKDDPARWQFAQFEPTARHKLAVATERVGTDLEIAVEPIPAAMLLEWARD